MEEDESTGIVGEPPRYPGAPQVHHFEEHPGPTRAVAEALVQGEVELIELPNGDQMLVNGEGTLLDLPYNPIATSIAVGATGFWPDGLVVGSVVILRGAARWA